MLAIRLATEIKPEPWDAHEGLGVAFWQWLPSRSSSVIPVVIALN